METKPHKWAKEIKAWADGAEVEFSNKGLDNWNLLTESDFHCVVNESYLFRIKPQPKEPIYVYAWLVKDTEECVWYFDKPEGVLNDDYHQYIGKIRLETKDE